MKHKKNFFLGILVALFTIAIDQLCKWYLLTGVQLPIIVTDFFNLVMVWNHGISFGMFSHHRAPFILTGIALIVVVILLRWLCRAEHTATALGIGFVIGGALGNVVDRVRFQAVADFFDFHVLGYHWPSFNIADSAIFVGVVVLSIESMIRPSSKEAI